MNVQRIVEAARFINEKAPRQELHHGGVYLSALFNDDETDFQPEALFCNTYDPTACEYQTLWTIKLDYNPEREEPFAVERIVFFSPDISPGSNEITDDPGYAEELMEPFYAVINDLLEQHTDSDVVH